MDDKEPIDQPPEVEFVYLGTPFTKILENVVSEGKAVVKRGNFAHLNLAPETSLLSKRKQREANRLHGAFTGGFSAGYFNTVGTKEGWTTSTFKSSREKRADAVQQAPELFMDEEDFGEFGIAPKQISLTNAFSTVPMGVPKASPAGQHQDDQLLSQLLQPVRLTFGAKLYRKQLHKGAKVNLDSKDGGTERVYGCAMPQSMAEAIHDEDAEGEKELADFYQTVADARQQMSHVTNTSKFFGLGYASLASGHDAIVFGRSDAELSILHADKNARMEAIGGTRAPRGRGKSGGISGFAFGTGVGEEDDTDDFNNITNLLGYDDRNQYDFAIGDLKEEKTATPRGSDEVEFQRGKSAKVVRPVYSAPVVPNNWVPKHKVDKTRGRDAKSNDHQLNVLERAAKLEESYPVSVLLPDTQRAKLSAAKLDDVDRHRSSTDRHRHSVQAKHPDGGERTDKEVKGEEQSKRGELFYTRKIETDQVLDWEQQTGPGALRSHLYQPMLAQIQSRFTTGGMVSDTNQVKTEPEAESEQMVAVRMNLFGKMTRTSFDWHPDRLLCKRFNVPHPYPESELVGTIGTGKVRKEKNSNEFAKSSAGLGFAFTQEEVRGKEADMKKESNGHRHAHDRRNSSHSSHKSDGRSLASSAPQHLIDMFEPICPQPDLFAKVFAFSETEGSSEESDADEAEPPQLSLMARLAAGSKTFKPLSLEPQPTEKFSTAHVKQEVVVEPSATTSAMSIVAQDTHEEPKIEEELLYGPPVPPEEFLQHPVEIECVGVEDISERSHKKKRPKSRSDSSSPRRRRRSRDRRNGSSRSGSRKHKHKRR